MEKAPIQKKPPSEQIERPIKQKQIKGKTSFVCAGKLNNSKD